MSYSSGTKLVKRPDVVRIRNIAQKKLAIDADEANDEVVNPWEMIVALCEWIECLESKPALIERYGMLFANFGDLQRHEQLKLLQLSGDIAKLYNLFDKVTSGWAYINSNYKLVTEVAPSFKILGRTGDLNIR